MIQFRFNPRKGLQAISRMLTQHEGGALDFHAILKTVYFADKQALNEHGRPIFGARYRAMNYGPVPLEIYEMIKCEPYWLSELGIDDYPWIRSGYRIHLDRRTNDLASPDDISPVEIEILDRKLEESVRMTFDQRTRETHGLDWLNGTRRIGERMEYEDMISPDHPQRKDLIEDLTAMGPRIVL